MATPYAIKQGAKLHDSIADTDSNGYLWWWLRSPDLDPELASFVNDIGWVLENGDLVSYNVYVVRPALWINI